MCENIKLKLTYYGPDVDDGTILTDDLIPALQGITNAYCKIASTSNLELKPKIRLAGINKGSFEIIFAIWNQIPYDGQKVIISSAASIGEHIIKQIFGIIKIKKHVKNQLFTDSLNNNTGNVNLTNCFNNTIQVNPGVYSLYLNKPIERELNKIAQPLENGKIIGTVIDAEISNDIELTEEITLSDKPSFDVDEKSITTTKELILIGNMNSLTKSTNKGEFILSDGTRVKYKISAENPEMLYPFFIYKGSVKINCIAHLDENLKPILLEVFSIEHFQTQLFESPKKEE